MFCITENHVNLIDTTAFHFSDSTGGENDTLLNHVPQKVDPPRTWWGYLQTPEGIGGAIAGLATIVIGAIYAFYEPKQ